MSHEAWRLRLNGHFVDKCTAGLSARRLSHSGSPSGTDKIRSELCYYKNRVVAIWWLRSVTTINMTGIILYGILNICRLDVFSVQILAVRSALNSAGNYVVVSTISTLCVICATCPNIMLAEQYLSCDNLTARSTADSDRPCPLTMKWKWMCVNTFGSVSARVARNWTWQSDTFWRARCKISTTSNAEQPPVPMSSISIGRGPRFRPPASGAPSMTTAWPLPDSPINDMPALAPTQRTVHSILIIDPVFKYLICLERHIIPHGFGIITDTEKTFGCDKNHKFQFKQKAVLHLCNCFYKFLKRFFG